MTPQELHEACHDACKQCPQFAGYDDDQTVGSEVFGDIPKKGMYAVYKFWKEEPLLWDRGYAMALPQEAINLFHAADKAIEKALKEVFR